MKPARLSRTLHKWLALFVGLQLVLWTVSGFYMVVVDLDFIHGDPLVRNLDGPIGTVRQGIGFGDVVRAHPGAHQITLRALPGLAAPVYELTFAQHSMIVDAASGQRLSPLTENAIARLARQYYAGEGELRAMRLLERDPPLEIQSRPLPLWRVDFDDWLETSLYLHPDTGRLVTRRHRFWRWFDVMWMFHIMDYETRQEMNNPLLKVSTVLGTVTALSGAWLLYFSFRRRRAQPA